jgi:hypothetical protein
MRSLQFTLLLMIHESMPVHAESSPDELSRVHIGIEFGPAWFSRNDVRIPGTTGTKFDMTGVTGSGPNACSGRGGQNKLPRMESCWGFALC